MRKVLILGGVTFATLLLSYFVWVQFPRLSDPQFVEQTIANGQAFCLRGQTDALDPAKNGYLRKEFLPYWGRKGQEHVENSSVEATITGWSKNFSTSGKGKLVDHHELQKAKDPLYLRSRSEFEKLLPALEASMRTETFVAPETKFSLTAVELNWIAVRCSTQAMTGWIESLVAAGQFDSAAGHLGSLYRWLGAIHGKGPLIGEMISVAMGAITDNIALGLFTPSAPLTVQSRQKLAQEMLHSIPSKHTLALVEVEASKWLLQFREVRSSSPPLVRLLDMPMGSPPGFFHREERIYANAVTRLLKEYKASGQMTQTSADKSPTLIDRFSGQGGALAFLDSERLVNQLARTRARRIAVYAVYASLAFRAQNGRLPKDLAELSASFPFPADSAEIGLEYTVKDGKGNIHIPYDRPEEVLDSKFPKTSTWVKAKRGGLTFEI